MAKPLLSKKKALAAQEFLARAMQFHQMGLLAEAEAAYAEVLAADPRQAQAQHLLGTLRGQQGRFDEALALVGGALRMQPNSPAVLSDHGLILHKLARHAEALATFDKVLTIKGDHVAALSNRGNVLSELGRHDEAIASYDCALATRPDHLPALVNRGHALAALGRHAEALQSFERALALRPDDADAHGGRGQVLCALARHEEALQSFDRVISLRPGLADAHYGRGNALAGLRRYEEAVASYDRALAIAPHHAAACDNRGNALAALKRYEAAIASYLQALVADAANARVLNNLGTALKELGRYAQALARYDEALAIRPDFADALYNRGNVLKEMRRYEEARAAYHEARRISPDHPDAFGLLDVAAGLCDWDEAEQLSEELAGRMASSRAFIGPFTWLGLNDDPALQLRCAQNYIDDKVPVRPQPLRRGGVLGKERIRLAYLSADFREHATAFLVAELFELHDRVRFEVIGISFGREEDSAMRRRLVAGFDQFHDVRSRSDREIASLMRDLDVDIAVDLKGYTQESRPEILAQRGAPVQVNYLGYPGSMGADFVDYVIADKVVLPFDQQPFYTEKIVHLPDCYQVNDRQRRIADRGSSREEEGLPSQGFVFCCFNNNYKITRPVFGVWMRLLRDIPQSVLWLLRDNAGAEHNLRRQAAAYGVDASRLVFAPRTKLDVHLARQRHADLFLDTLPYNAHTTASDALWAGVPVLTCLGRSFAGRVAASLLHSVGLPELVASTLDDYETIARRLAGEPALLAGLRERLSRNRLTQPLFDSARFCQHIEAAYATMRDISARGELPRSFTVAG
jgi:predicted O-linked N-acetylglucosamine transferase (SPINDLY family)